MRGRLSLGQVNAVLIALYFIPVWGAEAARALSSKVYGLDDRIHLAASVFYRRLFELDGIARVAATLAGLKLILATLFLAYVIDAMRGLVIGREEDRATIDLALIAAAAGIMLFGMPAVVAGQEDLTRLYATQFLMVTGAIVVVTVERGNAERANLSSSMLSQLDGLHAASQRPFGTDSFRS